MCLVIRVLVIIETARSTAGMSGNTGEEGVEKSSDTKWGVVFQPRMDANGKIVSSRVIKVREILGNIIGVIPDL